ncbi:hypothetical protein [Pectinatus haikarae]|uniref:Uncharacterized protein n=1 Tax=Pectinatus haikarae TaxID=349096 RepID=A0ABT9Y8I6_9FIRM|nr:hypothetical protein [Pectinatus haikarae]MDQ0204122.1 hypothetical protein [Pectinatus haikarae]
MGPAKACFEVIHLKRAEIPGLERLSDVIKKCYEYYHEGDDGIKMGLLKEAAENLLDKDVSIPVLKISDYNTIGLTGVNEEKGSNWTGLVREISATNKGNGLSGSFGVGKFAPFNFSLLRTIIYSTLNKDNETALQGKTILTTFLDNDNKLKQNVGLFGLEEDEDCKAIHNVDDIPEIFRRDKYGTDLFVLGFKEENEWMQQVAVSVLEYFFYTISIGNLEVSIIDGDKKIYITKDNLSNNMAIYNDYCKKHDIGFSAPIFWNILNDTSGKTKHFKENFRKKGNAELYLSVDPDFTERRILEMRTAGMKIQEDTAFRIGAYFYGIFIATGEGSKSDEPKDDINSFLRKCENQAHDTWSKDEYEDNREEADKVIKAIHSWILDKIKKEMPEIESDEIKAYGLSDLLPNQNSDSTDDKEDAYSSFKPKPRPVSISSSNRKNNIKKSSDVSIVDNNLNNAAPADIMLPSDNGDKVIHGGGQEQNPSHSTYTEPYPGPFPGLEPTTNPKPSLDGFENISGEKERGQCREKGSIKLHVIHITEIRTPYDSSKDIFRVSFIPEKTVDDAYVRLKIGSDDDDKQNADIKSASSNGETLEIYKELIMLKHINKGNKITLSVKLHNARRCPLEVTAYAK